MTGDCSKLNRLHYLGLVCWDAGYRGRSIMFSYAASLIRGMASMSQLAQNEIQSDQGSCRSESAASHRRRPLRVLFVHRDAGAIESCLQELKKAQFTVSADFVLTLAQCTEQLRSQSYDVVVAEHPSPNWKGSRPLELLHQTLQGIPLLFLTTASRSESIVQLTADG